ncbi:helix-turn-helix transcriptional regulator [Bradyrhizobium sp. UFLA05-109]
MPSIDFELLTKISERLGDAALDPGLWPSLMQEICRAAHTMGAGLLQSDVRTADIPTTESTREIFRSYFDNHLHIDDVRALRGVPRLLNGSPIVSDQDLFTSEQEMLRDPLYADLNRFGFRWWSAIGFRAGNALWGLTLQRTTREGMFQNEELAALGRLSDRLTETATLSKAVGRRVLTGITNAFGLINQPAIALDRYGYVIEINARAEALFNDEFRIRNRRLFARDETTREALSDFIAKMRLTSDFVALQQRPIAIRRRLGSAIVVNVLPVDGAARSPFLGARAILALSEVNGNRSIDPTALQSLFGLTPAEGRLAAILALGVSLDEASVKLGVSRETVRNHLKSIFSKSGTSRQPELVALLAKIG